ncbi:MAG TPA: hypothetical protein VNW92_00230, partial [Polyangiaceae bacterium]|nr:hypothetical protein [Polyangiaceae bacterium]
MKLRRVAILAALSGMLAAPPALAADRACSPMTVETDANVRARWPELPERVQGAFGARPDIDSCARVRLRMTDAAITVAVVLPDGRSASRSVSRQADVVPTLEALLLVPERQAPAALEAAAAPMPEAPETLPPVHGKPARSPRALPASESVSTRVGGPQASDRDASSARSPAGAPSRLRVELSVAAGARIGDGQTSVGVGALSFLDIAGWLGGFEGRFDRYRTSPGPQDGAPRDAPALELAILAGRRLGFGTLALDLIAGPGLALRGGTSTSVMEVVGMSGQPTIVKSGTSQNSPRLLLGARLNLGARAVFHTFVGMDGDFGPVPATDPMGEVPPLPAWTVG